MNCSVKKVLYACTRNRKKQTGSLLCCTLLCCLPLFRCEGSAGSDIFSVPQTNEWHIAVLFDPAGTSLNQESTLQRPQSLSLLPAAPYIQENCLYSHRPFHYHFEAGLKFQICSPNEHSFAELSAADFFSQLAKSNTYREIRTDSFHFRVIRFSEFQKQYSFNKVFISNADLSGLNIQSPDVIKIPARFQDAGVLIAFDDENVYAAWPFQTTTDRLILFQFQDKQLRDQAAKILNNIDKSAAAFIKSLPVRKAAVTEAWLRPGGFIEVSSGEEAILSQIELKYADGRVQKFTFPLFDRSSVTLGLPGTLTEIRGLTISGADFDFSAPELYPSRYRSLERKNNSWEFTDLCLFATPCTNAGYHPDLIRSMLSVSEAENCTADDIRLHEYNPFGITEQDRIKTNGKFIELSAARDCTWDGYIHSDDTVIDLGNADLTAGERIVIAASAGYFPDVSFVRSGIRNISQNESLILEPGSRTLFEYNGSVFFYGSRQNETRLLKTVYSLIQKDGRIAFHPHSCNSMRPDLCKDHAMSPGSPEPSGTYTSYKISELLPQGSASGAVRYRNDEFIEFEPAGLQSENRNTLEITRSSDLQKYRYIFPSADSSSQRMMLINSGSGCISRVHPFISYSGLYLPDSAADYRFQSGDLIQNLHAGDDLLGQARENNFRSLTVTTPGNLNRPVFTEQWNQTTDCDGEASPNSENHAGPYAGVADVCMEPVCITVLSSEPFELLTDGMLSVEQPGLQCLPVLPAGSQRSFSSACLAEGRCLAFESTTMPVCRIETIEPSPDPGDHEYIRICANRTFTNQGLAVRDSSYSDEIINYSSRFGDLPPLFSVLDPDQNTLHAGRCAILADPDHTGTGIQLTDSDTVLWTIRSGSAIGNGLSNREKVEIYDTTTSEILCSYGYWDDTPPLLDGAEGKIQRFPNTCRDTPASFGVVP